MLRPRPFPLIQIGHPTLWKKSLPVSASEDLSQLVTRLLVTLKKEDGVGLAAPQVNKSLRLFVMDAPSDTLTLKKPLPLVMVNPSILSFSDEIVTDWEGCLSVITSQGLVFGPVPRARSITVTYSDLAGTRIQSRFDDFSARVFQHEYDHLEGILFLERMQSLKDLVNERTYRKIKKLT